MYDPSKVYRQEPRWIMLYILRTVDIGLKFEKSDIIDHFVFGYVDSDYAVDLDKCSSTRCYIFTMIGFQ